MSRSWISLFPSSTNNNKRSETKNKPPITPSRHLDRYTSCTKEIQKNWIKEERIFFNIHSCVKENSFHRLKNICIRYETLLEFSRLIIIIIIIINFTQESIIHIYSRFRFVGHHLSTYSLLSIFRSHKSSRYSVGIEVWYRPFVETGIHSACCPRRNIGLLSRSVS